MFPFHSAILFTLVIVLTRAAPALQYHFLFFFWVGLVVYSCVVMTICGKNVDTLRPCKRSNRDFFWLRSTENTYILSSPVFLYTRTNLVSKTPILKVLARVSFYWQPMTICGKNNWVRKLLLGFWQCLIICMNLRIFGGQVAHSWKVVLAWICYRSRPFCGPFSLVIPCGTLACGVINCSRFLVIIFPQSWGNTANYTTTRCSTQDN